MNRTAKTYLVWAVVLLAIGILGMTYGSTVFAALLQDPLHPTTLDLTLEGTFLGVIRFATFPVAAALGAAAIVVQVCGVSRRPAKSPMAKRCLIAGVVLLAVGAIVSALDTQIYSLLIGNPQLAVQIYAGGLVRGILQAAPGPIATALIGAAIIIRHVWRPGDEPELPADGPAGEGEEFDYDPGYSASGIVAFPPDEP